MSKHRASQQVSPTTRALLLLVVAMVTFTAACAATPQEATIEDIEDVDPARQWADQTLESLTLAEKVGQLFITHAYGATADSTEAGDVERNQSTHGVDTAAELVRRYHLGGVIYFGWADNLADPEQIAGLSNGLQTAALDDTGIPLLVSTDQEHGAVVRIGEPVTQFPGNLAIGATRQVEYAAASAEVIGTELRAMGLNQNWAPVADVNVNPANPVIGTRSFGADPQSVAEFTAAAVRGYQTQLVASAKHFPGHGDTDVDSHTDLPEITHDREQWWEVDAPPFIAAIDAGVDIVMSAHLRFPALDDSGTPATLSHPILTGLLREELGFDGIIVTDSLSMEGVRQDHTDGEVVVEALKAGADLLLMPPDIELAVNSVMDAVSEGELDEDRIDASVRRILELKHRRGIVDAPIVDVAGTKVVGSREHQAVADEVAAAAITVLRVSDDGFVPPTGPVLVTGVGDQTVGTLAEAITSHGPTTLAHASGSDPDANTREAVLSTAAKADAVVVVVRGVGGSSQQRQLIEDLVATGKPVTVLMTDAPYGAGHVESAAAVLVAYSDLPTSLRAAAAVICGKAEGTGRLPVDVMTAEASPGVLYPIGHG
ncbi:beta-N-acetylhexosaminidase [Stackebrandtia endophytica]|uniref:beta-N-acetylhexosaminidase n=1 Tax=Stackebrandtia endophytica TaxID=1496996 RepID=A0A543B177_9ACTN|nr:glycoside hydrolase family 3 protein [Stackebrandtia endophytica]TQL78571.1 beta-N-acetylhexosaminidase [Stackebrandtia endophytica]